MTEKRGLNYAIDYLKAFKPLRLVPDAIYKRAGITGLVSSLGHSLRREARKPDNSNRVNVSYSPDQQGHDVAYYTYNVDYKPLPKAKDSPPLYFFTRRYTTVPSPMFHNLDDLKADICFTKCCRIYSGSYDRPILVDKQ